MIAKVISGGQTGVDRAGLDAAIALGLPHGGWCPRGRRAEDGRIPDRYQLVETPSAEYPQRTEWNVTSATATLVLYDGRIPLGPGTRKTMDLARLVADRRAEPDENRWARYHEINLHPDARPVNAFRHWMEHIKPHVHVLNIAGPRESGSHGIYAAAYAFLMEVLKP